MRFARARVIVGMLLAMSCAATSSAGWAQCVRGAEYEQADAVKRRYPDPAVRFDTPALAPDAAGFTTYEEMLSYVQQLSGRTDNMVVRTAGFSQEGRAVPLLVLTNARRFAPAELRRLGRPVVLMVGQMHGNEPAGGEALLAVARSLADGELKPLLDRIQRGEIDPSFVITHREKLSAAPEMYKTFRDKADDCIKVVMTP